MGKWRLIAELALKLLYQKGQSTAQDVSDTLCLPLAKIDDFGRQRVSPDQLLNRWIVPLEILLRVCTAERARRISSRYSVAPAGYLRPATVSARPARRAPGRAGCTLDSA